MLSDYRAFEDHRPGEQPRSHSFAVNGPSLLFCGVAFLGLTAAAPLYHNCDVPAILTVWRSLLLPMFQEATHVCSTVEAAPLDMDFSVGVIDEVQLLADPHRGPAWTRAFLGLRVLTCVPMQMLVLCLRLLVLLMCLLTVLVLWPPAVLVAGVQNSVFFPHFCCACCICFGCECSNCGCYYVYRSPYYFLWRCR